ncbi:putative protein-tyrosine phosphatase [Planoprotostelium fungivorum]|uniref:protein-tyrosine-phosphatase n=1 Tax=Planoprotostelium fungivorum TaxID=1890364 RepID=A0A2P6NYF3_9EUKA|nr:putative protein-tyrosine phosphatase [Planoprotostelium fungivorum]
MRKVRSAGSTHSPQPRSLVKTGKEDKTTSLMSVQEVELVAVDPPMGSDNHIFALEPFTVRATLRTSYPINLVRAQFYTNLQHKLNPDGQWQGVDLTFVKKQEDGTSIFQSTFLGTSAGDFEYTIRMALRRILMHTRAKSSSISSSAPGGIGPVTSTDDEVEWKWASNFGQNGKIHVSPPSEDLPWTKGPQVAEVLHNLYIGNLSAASQCKELHFDALLNCSRECEVVAPPNIHYHKIPLADGANNTIRENDIRDAVAWVEQRLDQGAKTLVFCRAGLGRSGSVLISYLFYAHPEWTFQQTLDELWKVKSDVYPHKDLQNTLEKVFPRVLKPAPLLHRTGSVNGMASIKF